MLLAFLVPRERFPPLFFLKKAACLPSNKCYPLLGTAQDLSVGYSYVFPRNFIVSDVNYSGNQSPLDFRRSLDSSSLSLFKKDVSRKSNRFCFVFIAVSKNIFVTKIFILKLFPGTEQDGCYLSWANVG